MTREQLLESSLEQLEFERVLEEIARCTTSSLGVEHLADMLPMIDKRTIDWEISMVSEMRFFYKKENNLLLMVFMILGMHFHYRKLQEVF